MPYRPLLPIVFLKRSLPLMSILSRTGNLCCFKLFRTHVNLTGDLQNIVPWSRFSIYTEDNTSFNYINNGDTIFVKYGLYQSVDTDFFYNPIIFERKYKYDVSNFHFAITYLKRCSKPSEADNLIVNIKAFENGELYKEENCIMRAYQISERPSSDEYIYRFIF